MTPDDIARDIVEHFKPSGRCLDPCKGDGAFLRYLPSHSEWCEISEGRDFFSWDKPVDWIISNPPFSDYFDFFSHSFQVADNVVYVFPLHKMFQSIRNIELIYGYGGIVEIYVLGRGRVIGWELGFAVGAVYFKRGYHGPITVSFRHGTPNKALHPTAYQSDLPT